MVVVVAGEPFVFPSLGPTVLPIFDAATNVQPCPRSVLSGLTLTICFGVPHAPTAATTLIAALGLLRTPGELTVLMLAVSC